MKWLNYHHLLYFWTVAKEGTIALASKELGLAQPTISGQINSLEQVLGEKLFSRVGRGLVLTEVGQLVYGYADEIFTIGRELLDTLEGRPPGRPLKLRVGVADVVPKLIAHRLLAPVLRLQEPVQIICTEDKTEQLLAELAIHRLDLVLADCPIGPATKVRAFNHLLGECAVTFFAAPELAKKYRRNFPRSLDGAPFLLPTAGTLLRRSLDQWFETERIRPQIVAEIEDSALLKVFAQQGEGVFVAPAVIKQEITQQYGVKIIADSETLRERFYAITVERRIKHPATVHITEMARTRLFDHA